MLINPDCIPCILNMSVSVIRKLRISEDSARALFDEILEIPSLEGRFWEVTSAEVIEMVMRKITSAMNNPDPFYSEKLQQIETITSLYPSLKRSVEEAQEPLYEAVKLAIIGNCIDFMLPHSTKDVETSIKERVGSSLPKESYRKFEEELEISKLILYFGDNAGEIVFDKLLIETIKTRYDVDVVFVVRNAPTLNDATLKEARLIRLDKVTSVVENGIEGPLPGTILKRCSEEVRNLADRADLIISKGGGNFDTLDEEKKCLTSNIIFMLLSKCYRHHRMFGVPVNEPILANYFGRGESNHRENET